MACPHLHVSYISPHWPGLMVGTTLTWPLSYPHIGLASWLALHFGLTSSTMYMYHIQHSLAIRPSFIFPYWHWLAWPNGQHYIDLFPFVISTCWPRPGQHYIGLASSRNGLFSDSDRAFFSLRPHFIHFLLAMFTIFILNQSHFSIIAGVYGSRVTNAKVRDFTSSDL
jgi:hypothetical protein